MKCIAVFCLACAILILTPSASGAASPADPYARPVAYFEALEPAVGSVLLPLSVNPSAHVAEAPARVPQAPVRTVVPPRPDPSLPNYGISWAPTMPAYPDTVPQAAPPAVVAVATQVPGAPEVSIRIVVTVNGEDHVIELPAVTVGQVVQALASAVPTPTPPTPPPSPVALTPAPSAPVMALRPPNRNPAVITPRMPAPDGPGVYRVQVGSFARTALAQNCFDRLRSAGFEPRFERFGSMYRVVISGVGAAQMAEVAQRLGNAGFQTAWARREN